VGLKALNWTSASGLLAALAIASPAMPQTSAETREQALIRGIDQCLAFRSGDTPAAGLASQGFKGGQRPEQWGRLVEDEIVQLYIDRTSDPGNIGCSVATWPRLAADDQLRAAMANKAAELKLGERILREGGGSRIETWETPALNLAVLRTDGPQSMSAIVMVWTDPASGGR